MCCRMMGRDAYQDVFYGMPRPCMSRAGYLAWAT
jgi:hypothetical protein